MSDEPDYVRAQIEKIDYHFEIPPEMKEFAECFRDAIEKSSRQNVKTGAMILALVQILNNAGVTTFGTFNTLSKQIEAKLLKQVDEESSNASRDDQ